MKTVINWQLPIKTASEANSSEHWAIKSKRHNLQKRWINTAFRKEKPKISLPCQVTLTRISSRFLDAHDNLRMSLKYVTDAIAANITGDYRPGRADDSKEITWEYQQEKGHPQQVRIEIEYEENFT